MSEPVTARERGAPQAGAGGGAGAAADPTQDALSALHLSVPDMDCPSCLATISDRLSRVPGVVEVEGSPLRRALDVRYDGRTADAEAIRREVVSLGYDARPREEREASGGRPALVPGAGTWGGRQARIAYASASLFALGGILHLTGMAPRLFALWGREVLLPDLLFVASALVGGWNFFPKGIRAARALALDMNFLMTVAILGAVGIGEYVEGAAIAFLFAVAELLERYAVDRARASVEALVRLAPERARVRSGGREVWVPASELVPGDEYVVRPGDRLPADGTVAEGGSAVDEAPVTGEPMPVSKEVGDRVYSGTVNREGFLVVRVDRAAADSTLARIVRLVEEAQTGKTRTERFVERFARVYTPAVTVAAILTAVVPVLLFGAPFVVWFERALTLLVIACPCALVISTPVAVVSGVTAAARNGVLIKGGTYLEALGSVRAVALDKTGTLTFGRPSVIEARPVDPFGAAEVWPLVLAAESRSEHPVARAIVRHLLQSVPGDEGGACGTEAGGCGPGDAPDPGGEASCGCRSPARPAPDAEVEAFTAVPGRGVRARVRGTEVTVGSPRFVLPDVPVPPELSVDGDTVVAVALDGRPAAWIRVADRPRERARETLARLKEEGVERLVMLTGDGPEAAAAVGRRLGVDEVRAGLLPEDKVTAVRELTEMYGPVAMVGDGINDAPALATAAVGVVMGAAGSDAALETADIALMGDDLTLLPYTRSLSREAVRVIRVNIALALGMKAALVVGVPLGAVSLITAVLVGDMGVSLAVTLNALRLGRLGPRRSPREGR